MHTVVPNVGPGRLPVFLDIYGSNELEAEHLHAYEAGYRYETNSFTLDLATYYNDYNQRITTWPSMAILPSGVLLDYNYMNSGSAQSHGAEVSAQWRPIERWTLAGAATETRGSPDALQATPRHLFNLQSRFVATSKLHIETSLYHYGTVPLGRIAEYPTVPLQAVPSFDRLDVGGTWQLSPQWTFGVWGRNLQTPRHLELATQFSAMLLGKCPGQWNSG
jgi:iron complex outermembrane receptor protein